jgi:mono/diheme cytochrome c family protein
MQDMYNQPRYKPLAASPLWADGSSARPQVAGTISFSAGAPAAAASGRRTIEATGTSAPTFATLQRGRERYAIYCSPCHSDSGDGDGMVVRRGFPRPVSFHADAMRSAPDSRFLDAIVDGYGAMYSYADRVEPADRRAIVAFIRALQLSQNARSADLPPEDRAALAAAPK